jgi:hypothetical protein
MDVSVRQRIVKKLAERVGFPVMVWMSLFGRCFENFHAAILFSRAAVALLAANKTAPVSFPGAA